MNPRSPLPRGVELNTDSIQSVLLTRCASHTRVDVLRHLCLCAGRLLRRQLDACQRAGVGASLHLLPARCPAPLSRAAPLTYCNGTWQRAAPWRPNSSCTISPESALVVCMDTLNTGNCCFDESNDDIRRSSAAGQRQAQRRRYLFRCVETRVARASCTRKGFWHRVGCRRSVGSMSAAA